MLGKQIILETALQRDHSLETQIFPGTYPFKASSFCFLFHSISYPRCFQDLFLLLLSFASIGQSVSVAHHHIVTEANSVAVYIGSQ